MTTVTRTPGAARCTLQLRPCDKAVHGQAQFLYWPVQSMG